MKGLQEKVLNPTGYGQEKGGGACTVVAEIDGKMYSFGPPEMDVGGMVYWPRIRVETGKWTDCAIEVGSSQAQQVGP